LAGIHQAALFNDDLAVGIFLQLVPWKVLCGRTGKHIAALVIAGSMTGTLEAIIASFNDATQVGANCAHGPDALVVTIDK
jgi:hypothetical protein